jgi:hypothetical protein
MGLTLEGIGAGRAPFRLEAEDEFTAEIAERAEEFLATSSALSELFF